MCSRCGDLLCPTRPWKVCDVHDVCRRLEVLLYALEMLEGMRRVLRRMLEVVEDEICVLLEVLESLEVMRRVQLCMPEAVEVSSVLLEVLESLEVMRRVRLFCRRPWR